MIGARKLLATQASASFSPEDVSGLVLWLDADDATTITESGGNVTNWADKSSSGLDAVNGVGTGPATGTTTINGKNVLAYGGTNYLVSGVNTDWSWVTAGDRITVFWVGQIGNSSNPNVLYYLFGTATYSSSRRGISVAYDDRSSSSRNNRLLTMLNSSGTIESADTGDGAVTPNTPTLVEVSRDMNTDPQTIHVDGSSILSANNTGSASAAASNGLSIGAADVNQTPLVGSIAEVLVYRTTGALDSGDVSNIRTYLADKWGVTLA